MVRNSDLEYSTTSNNGVADDGMNKVSDSVPCTDYRADVGSMSDNSPRNVGFDNPDGSSGTDEFAHTTASMSTTNKVTAPKEATYNSELRSVSKGYDTTK